MMFPSNEQSHVTQTRQQSKVTLVSPSDAVEIRSWYEPDTTGQPTYADDPKWKDWWCEVIAGTDKALEVFKLSINNQIFGLIAVKEVIDWYDGKPTLYVNGLRVHPSIAAKNARENHYAGVGTALIEFAVSLSLAKGLEGIGLNSSIGAEGFYRRLGLQETPATDGKRTYFMLKGKIEREQFLGSIAGPRS